MVATPGVDDKRGGRTERTAERRTRMPQPELLGGELRAKRQPKRPDPVRKQVIIEPRTVQVTVRRAAVIVERVSLK